MSSAHHHVSGAEQTNPSSRTLAGISGPSSQGAHCSPGYTCQGPAAGGCFALHQAHNDEVQASQQMT